MNLVGKVTWTVCQGDNFLLISQDVRYMKLDVASLPRGKGQQSESAGSAGLLAGAGWVSGPESVEFGFLPVALSTQC